MSVNNMPAYTISNENQRWATTVIPDVKKVLTVAGSGDQALFYKLAGAKIVDTFDITCNARVVQDMKFVAIKNMNPVEYKELLIKTHRSDGAALEFFLCDMWNLLPDETQKIIQNGKFDMIFGCGLDASFYPENIPTPKEFEKLRKVLNKPFGFIWSDLESLSIKLTKKYDVINLSNIFDYCPDAKMQVKILDELSAHLTKNGRIVYLPQKQKFDYKALVLPMLAYEKTVVYDNQNKMIIFQRTR